MKTSTKGFSLIEVVIGVALIIIAVCGVSGAAAQLAKLHTHYEAAARLSTTVDNLVTDMRAALRYDGPAAAALRAGRVPASVALTQWEPDKADAPVTCDFEPLGEPNEHLHLTCRDRSGTHVARDVDLIVGQPFPGAIKTAAPTAEN